MFCEGLSKAGLTKIPDGFEGITKIISFFLNSVNKELSKPNRLNYPENINLVDKAVNLIIDKKLEKNLSYVPYEEAYVLLDKELQKFSSERGFLKELISEGVFSKNLFWNKVNNSEEGIYFSYERFEDHLIASHLLEEYNEDIQSLKETFGKGGELFKYIKNESESSFNRGLIEAFSIQLPELVGKELYEIAPHCKDFEAVIEAFIESLIWRKTDTISDKLKKYINKYVIKYKRTHEQFLDTLLLITSNPNHYFNADFLHNHLSKIDLPERDGWWTIYLNESYYYDHRSIKRIIDWGWSEGNKDHISSDAIRLVSKTLSWFLTSSNRFLRDSATKALVSLLKNRINVLINILKEFDNINDPYIYERLFAVAYGCAVRTKDISLLKDLGEYIYNVIFDQEYVYSHILLRDYARGIIEFALTKGIDLDINDNKIDPPYKSKWPEKIPSEEELKEKYYDKDDYFRIWDSVMYDFGTLGDFGNYVLNSSLRYWTQTRLSEPSKEEVLKKFKNNLTEKQKKLWEAKRTSLEFNHLESILDGEDYDIENFDQKIEECKEERKIAEENFKDSLTEKKLHYYEEEIEPFLDDYNEINDIYNNFNTALAQRWVFNRVIELGWNPKLHGDFDKNSRRRLNSYPRTGRKPERIGKKYQWIAFHEFLARVSDNFKFKGDCGADEYKGPWNPYIRDIDPTILIKNTKRERHEQLSKHWWFDISYNDWEQSHKDWLLNKRNLPDPIDLITVEDNSGIEWIVLEIYPEWSEPKVLGQDKWDNPHKRLWYQIRSYLIEEDKLEKIINKLKDKNFMGRWMPESSERYELYSREYYWSSAFDFFKKEYYRGKKWREVKDREDNEVVGEVMVTTENFLWEEEYDCSKEDTISFIKPAETIYKGMNMKFNKEEGEFSDENNRLICFDPSVLNESLSCLLIRKQEFIEFLKQNNLRIFWTVLGEKNISGGNFAQREDIDWLDLSGVYYLKDDKLKGEINFY